MTKTIKHIVLISTLLFVFIQHGKAQVNPDKDIKIAFMSDVHLHDIYGTFQDVDYKGIENSSTGKYTIARTMAAQLTSTRLFNENYFAFLAALDNAVAKGIKYIILPGDFSDDGQPVNVRGVKNILDSYSEQYGIHFFLTTGNHDPVRPFAKEGGKTDFLGEGGKSQIIMSKTGLYNPTENDPLPPVVTSDIQCWGYAEIVTTLGDYGFLPKASDLYWETPFSTYAYENYSYSNALQQADLSQRTYTSPPYNTSLPDVSYLVEPEEDLWILSIDANVYIPSSGVLGDPDNPSNYGSASVGYNNVLTYKSHLLEWVKEITTEANRLGKTLIVFSHYPMIDFNDNANEHIKNLLGENKMQVHRIPNENVAQMFADAGVKIHFAGHMHINDTGIKKTEKGNTLVNVQVPSLAAYIPAYKILSIHNQNRFEIETIVLDSVPRFDELFPLYQMEHNYLMQSGNSDVWNEDILQSTTYKEFANWHLKELVRLRFLKNDWPESFKNFLLNSSGTDLLNLVCASDDLSDIDTLGFETWTGFDMIYDFYRIHSADKLAIPDIGMDRIKQYKLIVDFLLDTNNSTTINDEQLKNDFIEFATILHRFLNGEPADHFIIDLQQEERTLVGHWNFDDAEDVEGAVIVDRSGLGHNGVVVGTLSLSNDTPSGSGKSMDNTLGTGFVSLGDPDMLQIAGNMTISAWVKYDFETLTRGNVVAKGHSKDTSDEVYFGEPCMHVTGKNGFKFQAWNEELFDAEGNLDPALSNTWIHMVGMHQDGFNKLYVNGKLNIEEEHPTVSVHVPNVWAIGTRGQTVVGSLLPALDPQRTFYGLIDDVRMYDGAITEDEIAALYHEGLGTNIDEKTTIGFKVYPGIVSNGILNIQLKNNVNYGSFNIYTISGQQVLSSKINGEQDKINVSHLSKGMYIISVSANNGFANQKFIIQ